MIKNQLQTPEQKAKFQSELVQCPHCPAQVRARGLKGHILLAHELPAAIARRNQQQQNKAA